MSIPEKKPEPLSLEEEIRALVEEGRIYEATKLLENAGDRASTVDPGVREILSPPRFKRVDKRDFDRTPEFNWFRANWDTYRGKWVAVSGENLVACEDTLKKLLAKLDGRKFEREPLLHHIL
ncbi:MAG: DUF5678 domain-containing protein [Thermoanaerobaculia bacterium]